MVPFARALATSYRPSIVTFPLSLGLRVSEIVSLLCSSTPLLEWSPGNGEYEENEWDWDGW